MDTYISAVNRDILSRPGGLEYIFKTLGFTFEVATQNYKIADEKNNIFAEVDVFLENGDKVMIVEIKATPDAEDIADHVRRMEKLRKRADLRGDTRKYLGALQAWW